MTGPGKRASGGAAGEGERAASTRASGGAAGEGERAASTLAAWLPRYVLVAAIAVLVHGAAGGPGWTRASADAVLASGLERPASAPLYGIVAGAAAYLLPAGEPGFRLAVANAVLGALVLLGVMRAARALLPKDPVAGAVAALLLALTPPFRDAAGFAGPSMLAACGAVWAFALAAAAARESTPRAAAGALACAGVTIGAAPWLGALLALLIVAWLSRAREAYRNVLAAGAGVLGALLVVMWAGAIGRLPGADPSLSGVVAATGRGAAGIVVGAGLLGAAFAALTRLASAGWLAAAIALAAGHAIAVDREPAALLALLAAGAALVPGAIVRVAAASSASTRRHAVAVVAGVPLLGAAIAAGPARSVDDPGDSPARLAGDLLGELPPGPGIFAPTRATGAIAIRYAQAIAGARPDLQLAPATDDAVVEVLRRGGIAGSDTPAFGRLDPRRARPRGRGFQLLAEPPATGAPVPAPARYRTPIGEAEAIALALARARYEAGYVRFDLAARAAGLVEHATGGAAGEVAREGIGRFRAADLALLSVTAPTPARPALFGFIPPLGGPPGERWVLELLGDDLAWVAGLPQPDATWPAERVLHALWRKVWRGELDPHDPSIAALGWPAVFATHEMLAVLRR